MLIARACGTTTAAVLCCLVLVSISTIAEESPPAPAQSASAGSLITYANATLDRIVLIDDSSGKILSYARTSEGGYRLEELRDFRKDLARTKADLAEALRSPLRFTIDVLGEDPPGFERLEGGVRIMATHSDRGRYKKEGWTARYVFTEAPETVLARLWTRLSGWKVSETKFELGTQREGARTATVRARKGRLDLSARLTTRPRGDVAECELWVRVEKESREEP